MLLQRDSEVWEKVKWIIPLVTTFLAAVGTFVVGMIGVGQ
jgi:hypothetical protein